MVPLDRAVVSFYRLSIETTLLSAAVWPQFAMQVIGGGVSRPTPCLVGTRRVGSEGIR